MLSLTVTGDVVVTGAAQGIGRAIVEALAGSTARVWCVDENLTVLEEAVATFNNLGVDAHACRVDVGDLGAVDTFVKELDAAGAKVTGLVNNAGIWPRSPAVDLTPEDWDRTLAVNIRGPFFLSQHLARRIIARGESGSIVNITSGQAFAPVGMGAHYAVSKAGIVNLTRSLAVEWSPLGIRVNCVAPGITDTAQPRNVLTVDELNALAERFPMRRIGQPDDIAPAVLFLLSDAARYITGECIVVNGGQVFR